MDYLKGLIENHILLVALAGWAIAQFLKALIYVITNKKFLFERLVGSGGMPSSHASTVCALVVATAKSYSTASFEFTIALILAIVVIYDARGVRLETGKQAVTISAILDHFIQQGTILNLPKMELKELVGHTPFQVLVGSLLGILVGLLL